MRSEAPGRCSCKWGRAARAGRALTPVFRTPDESSEDEGADKLEEEEEDDEAGGRYRLGARDRALSPGLEESGLGLLARFAASALPSPTVGPSLSVVQLEAKQKARKKEERQSLMGEWGPRRLQVRTLRLRAGGALVLRLVTWAPACCFRGGAPKAGQSDLQPTPA